MKIIILLLLSLKYLWRYKRRYLFLFITLGFGFGVLTVISALKDGMKDNLYRSAQSHYAGDISTLGYLYGAQVNNLLTKAEQDAIFTSAQAADINPESIAIRTTLQGRNEGTLYFNGIGIPLKYIVGIDWDLEKGYLDKLPYTKNPDSFSDDAILLSKPIADELGIEQGDSLVLEVLTTTGQKNTGTLIVAGIVDESNFFSYYKVFIYRLTLNRLIGYDDTDCSLIGFFIKDKKDIEKKRELMYLDLKERIQTGPLVYDRNAFNKATDAIQSGITIFLLTLPVHLSEVAQLMDAIDLASYVLFAMMLLIIMVSAMVTCRLILHERTKETATMRAIGFYESDLRFVLHLEVFIMAFCSMVAGFFLALIINRFLSYSSFSWFPGFEVFMENGRLAARYLPYTIVVNIIATLIMLFLAIGGSIFRFSRNPLPKMLSGGMH